MNPSDWIKAVALVTQHRQETAITETDQLSSMPLSQLAMDDSSSPVVHYGMHMPAATSTPTGTEEHMHSSQQEDCYQQIISGIPRGSLYPTLSSLSSEAVPSQEEAQSLRDKVSKGLEKYLQDAEQCRAIEVNYFNDNARCMREEPNLDDAEQTIRFSKGNLISAKQMSIKDTNVARDAPESLKSDTSHTSRQSSEVPTDAGEKHQQITTSEDIKPHADTQHHDGKHPDKEIAREPTSMYSEQLHTMLTCIDEVIMPTKKVGCILVTSNLRQFLEDYPPSSDKQAFLDIYHMLSLLDKYLFDNLEQHTHCMSSDKEYVTLLKYALHLNIDLTTFPTLWAVLSILLDTKDGKCECVKCLQEEYNTYYEEKSRKYMLKLEKKSLEIQNCMHDSVTQNFDRVSGLHDNGSNPSQGKEDNQPVDATTPENAIDDDVVDIMTIYPLWSMDTNGMCDIVQTANDKSIKDIRDEIGEDMPVKTEINKPYIDNIDAYNRDKHLITTSLSDMLDLLGAQQVRVAVKHTNQIVDFPEHLRQINLGEEMENISYAIMDRNVSFIPQVDGIIDSRDSLDRTPDSINLTEFPVKNIRTQKQIEKTNEDISENDTDDTITYETDELKKTDRKKSNALGKKAKNIEVKKGRNAKIYTMNIERKIILKQRREQTLQNAQGRNWQRNISSQL